MRRLKLSTKMLVAALPLIIAVVALLAVSVRDDLADISDAEHGAELGGVWQPLIDTLGAIEYEADPVSVDDASARTTTNANMNRLQDAIVVIGAAEAASDHVTKARSALSAARRNIDMAALDMQTEIDPAEAYAESGREIVAVGELLPAEAGDPQLGSELLAVVKLADAKLAADQILYGVSQYDADPTNVAALTKARSDFATLDTLLGEFEAIAPEDWAAEFRQAGFASSLASYRSELDRATRAAQVGDTATFDAVGFEQLVDGMVSYQTTISNEIVDRANAEADATRSATLRRIGIILAITLAAVLLAWIITRSITKRIRAVAKGANQVSTEQLPALVSALRDPKGKGTLPEIERISARGSDELAELAESFNSMQDTLVDVAHEQVEVLRRGVSDIFVTMARRNRSLIDRQLAMLDEYEAEVDDPEVLSNYYQLDHMATRMRRNSESLLVLANAEPKRRRVRATEVDDVVRAAIGEVEDYRRIEIEALESLQVRGNVVADISHLLAELLDNATSFSPPDSYVRVGGRMSEDGYMIRIVDSGVGIGTQRLKELNELLREPPVVGLSVESTLGMSVVSLLANKHGIGVNLASGNPGLIVDVVLPPSLFGPIDATPPSGTGVAATSPESGVIGDGEAPGRAVTGDHLTRPDLAPVNGQPVVAWDDSAPGTPADESFETQEPITSYEPDDERPVAASDWRSMSLNLAAFQQGMKSASEADEESGVEANGEAPGRAVTEDHLTPLETQEPVGQAEPTPPGSGVAGDDALEDNPVSGVAGDDDEVGVTEDHLTPPEHPVSGVAGDDDEVGVTEDHLTPPEPSPPAEHDPDSIEALAGQVADDEPAAPTLPPPSATPVGPRAEFAVPPAPPVTAAGQSFRPVTPDNARTVARPQRQEDANPSLPTRSPGQGPDGGPDRLASALDSGLPTRQPTQGPDGGPDRLSGDTAPTPLDAPSDSLPTRTRVGDPVDPIEEPAPAAQSGADPNVLRDRLRSFQAEFRSAMSDDASPAPDADHDNPATPDPQGHDQFDLGGDRR